jgi:hypothetical protein
MNKNIYSHYQHLRWRLEEKLGNSSFCDRFVPRNDMLLRFARVPIAIGRTAITGIIVPTTATQ